MKVKSKTFDTNLSFLRCGTTFARAPIKKTLKKCFCLLCGVMYWFGIRFKPWPYRGFEVSTAPGLWFAHDNFSLYFPNRSLDFGSLSVCVLVWRSLLWELTFAFVWRISNNFWLFRMFTKKNSTNFTQYLFNWGSISVLWKSSTLLPGHYRALRPFIDSQFATVHLTWNYFV